MMPSVHIVSVKSVEQPIHKVQVYNDRAEVTRVVKAQLNKGINEVHIKNITKSLVRDSVRVNGRGDGSIHEVLVQDRHSLNEEADSPQVAESRSKCADKEKEINAMKDKLATQNIGISALDKMISEIGVGILPKDPNVTVDGNLSNITKILSFYNANAAIEREAARETKLTLAKTEEELKKLVCELLQTENCRTGTSSSTVVVVLESENGGSVELDLVYQVHDASWRPSYDLRVQSSNESSLKISYFGLVTQRTGEDWIDVPLVLSTAQPCLGGRIPELGTLEASIHEKYLRDPNYVLLGGVQADCSDQSSQSGSEVELGVEDCVKTKAMDHVQVSNVKDQALSTEFHITRPASIPSKRDEHKVTIRIVDLAPQLIYQCVPSKNTSVFLTATSVNHSELPFLSGPASVYLNSAFVAKTHMKTVSPGERFSCSLGVDPAIRVEYKPAKKYHEEVGFIRKTSTNVTEQMIKITNTKNVPVLLTVKEHLPRSTDEKIKIHLMQPSSVTTEEASTSVTEGPSAQKKGCLLNAENNLELTVELQPGEISNLVVKYGIEHPNEEKIQFCEKF